VKQLHYFNFFGVLALAALCVAQWHRDRQLNLEINRLEKTRFEQAARFIEQEHAAKSAVADLARFKELFTKSHDDLADALQKLRTTERLTNQLTLERAQLRTSITNWAAAVATRDERLKEANGKIHRLSDELNASVRKFNELATNYVTVITERNDLLAHAPPNQLPQQPEPELNP
jgi:chromosome segregation ATPase